MTTSYTFEPIGLVESPYPEKFGIPRQPGLAPNLISKIKLLGEYNNPDTVRGLEQCSHIWLLFIFSECSDSGWTPTVRPPRLGGNKRMGVFATRSPFRPNPIGMSPVKLLAIEKMPGQVTLVVSSADLLDGTPVIDIKPYLPYSDHITGAECTFATDIPLLPHDIIFSEPAHQRCVEIEAELQQPFRKQVEELLRCDPRPAYKQDDPEKSYGVRLHHTNIRFRITANSIIVDEVEAVTLS